MSPRRDRLIESLPVLAAFAVFAVALDRPLFSLAAALAVLAVVARRVERSFGSLGLALSGVLGGAIGLVLLAQGDLPRGPIPPSILAPLTGALVGFSSYCVLQKKNLYSWIYAWLLVVVSLNALPSAPLWAALALLAVAQLAAVFHGARFGDSGSAGWVGFALFAVVTAMAGAGVATGVKASEGALVNLVYEYVKGLELPSGVAFDQSVSLLSRSRVEPRSRTLFEIDGQPDRLRTAIYDVFDGAQFTTSPAHARPLREPPAASGTTIRHELLLFESLGQRWPALAGTRRITGASAVVHPGWIWEGQGEVGAPAVLESEPGDRLPVEPAPGDDTLFLPENLRADFLEIARREGGFGTGARDRARALERWLQRDFTYSLDTDLRGSAHPLLMLLREKRPAYCIYFASALAVLLRSDGIPSRLVGGFLPSESNAMTGRTLVRQRDAHAWVEAWISDESRWVAFDPTPSESRDELLSIERDRGWAGRLADALSSTLRRAWARFRHDPGEFLSDLASSPWVFGPLGLAGAWTLWRRRRSRTSTARVREALAADPALRVVYARYLKAIARLGLTPAPGESDDEFLSRVRSEGGEALATDAASFLEGYRAVRYGSAPDRSQLAAALALLESRFLPR